MRQLTVICIIPHADDAALYCGGTLARISRKGHRIVLVRVTNDDKDSVGISTVETIERNRAELRIAANLMGITRVIDLDYPSDVLGDVSEVQLREHFVRLIRQYVPYAVFSFDPYGVLYENNQDHIKVAQAVDEAFWISMFDKHHPEHFVDGLAVHSVCERWYFARRLLEVNRVVDIAETLQTKIAAACANSVMMKHIIHQYRLQTNTWGRVVPELNAASKGDHEPFVKRMIVQASRKAGSEAGYTAAEHFRVQRFGAVDEWFETTSTSLPSTSPEEEEWW